MGFTERLLNEVMPRSQELVAAMPVRVTCDRPRYLTCAAMPVRVRRVTCATCAARGRSYNCSDRGQVYLPFFLLFFLSFLLSFFLSFFLPFFLSLGGGIALHCSVFFFYRYHVWHSLMIYCTIVLYRKADCNLQNEFKPTVQRIFPDEKIIFCV